MALEIERKFLVTGSFEQDAFKSIRITQGYISLDPERIVRIRRTDDKAYLTIKSMAGKSGITRFEWEKEISPEDADMLLKLCVQGVIDKTRFFVDIENKTFEVDVFHGDNEGLIIAEIELNSESENFPKPAWLGEEVSFDERYYNSYLVKHPYKFWIK